MASKTILAIRRPILGTRAQAADDFDPFEFSKSEWKQVAGALRDILKNPNAPAEQKSKARELLRAMGESASDPEAAAAMRARMHTDDHIARDGGHAAMRKRQTDAIYGRR